MYAGAPQVPTIELSELPEDGFLLDVREVDEWQCGRAARAVHMPLQTLPDHVDDLPDDRVVYVICRSGSRSAYAAGWLGTAGVEAVNVAGGMVVWEQQGRPLVGDVAEPFVR